MRGILQVLAVWWVAGAMAEPSQRVMGGLSWCSTLCMCNTKTQEQVKCYSERDVYDLLGYSSRTINRLRKINWELTSTVEWCTDLCLCHAHNGNDFECVEPGVLRQFITDTIGEGYFYDTEEESEIKQEQERSVDQEVEEEAARRAERRKNRRNRKNRKHPREKTKAPEPVEEQSLPEPEPEPEFTQELAPVAEPTSSPSTTLAHVTFTPPPPTLPLGHQDELTYGREDREGGEEEPEPLPKQEAVAASPAVTALQPPTRRLPFTTAESYTPRAAVRDVEVISPRVQPVLEVPKEKKTMASKVSQDLDELGSTVLDIRIDVLLNQRILLVTAAIAGIALIGMVILAIQSCTSRRQQASEAAKKRDACKDDNHSPKMNLQEAW